MDATDYLVEMITDPKAWVCEQLTTAVDIVQVQKHPPPRGVTPPTSTEDLVKAWNSVATGAICSISFISPHLFSVAKAQQVVRHPYKPFR